MPGFAPGWLSRPVPGLMHTFRIPGRRESHSAQRSAKTQGEANEGDREGSSEDGKRGKPEDQKEVVTAPCAAPSHGCWTSTGTDVFPGFWVRTGFLSLKHHVHDA